MAGYLIWIESSVALLWQPWISHSLSKSFIYQQMHFISVLESIKIYIKTYLKTAPTCFGLRPSSGSLQLSLAKVTFMKIGKNTSLCTMRWCGSILYQVSLCAAHSTHTTMDLMRNNHIMLTASLWHVVPCCLVYRCQYCRGNCCLSVQDKGYTPKM